MAEEGKKKIITKQFEVSDVEDGLSSAPVIVIDGAHGIGIIGETVRFNFVQDRLLPFKKDDDLQNPQNVVRRAVVARIVMDKPTFLSVLTWMNSFAKDANLIHQEEPDA